MAERELTPNTKTNGLPQPAILSGKQKKVTGREIRFIDSLGVTV